MDLLNSKEFKFTDRDEEILRSVCNNTENQTQKKRFVFNNYSIDNVKLKLIKNGFKYLKCVDTYMGYVQLVNDKKMYPDDYMSMLIHIFEECLMINNRPFKETNHDLSFHKNNKTINLKMGEVIKIKVIIFEYNPRLYLDDNLFKDMACNIEIILKEVCNIKLDTIKNDNIITNEFKEKINKLK